MWPHVAQLSTKRCLRGDHVRDVQMRLCARLLRFPSKQSNRTGRLPRWVDVKHFNKRFWSKNLSSFYFRCVLNKCCYKKKMLKQNLHNVTYLWWILNLLCECKFNNLQYNTFIFHIYTKPANFYYENAITVLSFPLISEQSNFTRTFIFQGNVID